MASANPEQLKAIIAAARAKLAATKAERAHEQTLVLYSFSKDQRNQQQRAPD